MKLIPSMNYFDEGVFRREKQLIFEKEWLFACLKKDLPKKRDWIIIDVLGKSVILYNNGNEIKAFQNVCPHRFNKIFSEEKGNSGLICKYHHWAFNDQGKLILNKENINLYPEPIADIACLKSYDLDTVEDFVFINLSPEPKISLSKHLGDEIAELLSSLSIKLHEKIFDQKVKHACNWKFIVENVIETKHCMSLHRDTLVKAGFCNVPPDLNNEVVKNSYFIIPLPSENLEKKRSYFINYLFGKENVNRFYKHTFIYPNLVISEFEGINFNIGRIDPISERSSVFNMKFYLARPNTTNEEILLEYKRNTIDFGRKVFEEDREVLENLQLGVEEIDHDGFQYKSEKRVEWFINSYFNSINNNGVSNF